MSSSDITVAALTATPTLRGNKCAWTYSDPRANALPNIGLDMVEVHASTTNDRATATKVGEGITDFPHDGLIEEQAWYYWIKARDYLGSFGAWYPSGSTSGVSATATGIAGLSFGLANGKLVASVASNVITIAMKTAAGNDPSAGDPVFVAFRNATLATGNYVIRTITSALNVSLPNGATAGFSNSIPGRLWGSLIDVGDGTVKIGLQNCSTSTTVYSLPEYGLVTTVVNNTSADNAGVMYADAVVSSRPFRIAAFFDWNSGLATAGAWSAGPDLTQMFGPGIKRPGEIVQSNSNISTAVLGGPAGTVLPVDDTIPQNTEGDQFFSTSITPTSPVNWIVHDALLYMAVQTQTNGAASLAMFQDSNASALVAAAVLLGPQYPLPCALRHRHQALTSSQTTFKLRAGPPAAFTGLVINGICNPGTGAATRLFGGVMPSGHNIQELMG